MRMYYRYGPSGRQAAVLVDMDGTLVDVSSLRELMLSIVNEDGTYQVDGLDTFHEQARFCPAIWKTIDRCENWWTQGYSVLIVTARSERYREYTKEWLNRYCVPYTELFMRAEGDLRPDYDVKKDLLYRIREKWDVEHAIDDNPSVLQLWEEEKITTTVVPGWEA